MVSREVVLYGLILLSSGVSQLALAQMTYWPISLFITAFGASFIVIGVSIVVLGLRWRWGPWKKPLGIRLWAIGFVVVGFLSIGLGGWIFTPLFILAALSFLVAWALWVGKKWAKPVLELLTVGGFLVSVAGVSNDGVIYVPGVLGASYMFWYLNRPQVANYFSTEPRRLMLSQRNITLILAFSLLLFVPLVYLYLYPPSRVIADHWNWTGGGGGVGGGPEFTFYAGDRLDYEFQADVGSPVEFSIGLQESPLRIASSSGRSGSGVVVVPISGPHMVYVETESNYLSISFEIIVTTSSLQKHVAQWGLLNFYLIVLLLWIGKNPAQFTPSAPSETNPITAETL